MGDGVGSVLRTEQRVKGLFISNKCLVHHVLVLTSSFACDVMSTLIFLQSLTAGVDNH